MKFVEIAALVVVTGFLVTLGTPSHASERNTEANRMAGYWTHESSDSEDGVPFASISLRLQVDGREVSGSYCYVFNYGRKIDCPDGDRNVDGRLSDEPGDATVTIHSFLSNADFRAHLRLVGEALELTSDSNTAGRRFARPKNALLRREIDQSASEEQ